MQLVVRNHGIRSLSNDIVRVCMCTMEVGSLCQVDQTCIKTYVVNRLCGVTT